MAAPSHSFNSRSLESHSLDRNCLFTKRNKQSLEPYAPRTTFDIHRDYFVRNVFSLQQHALHIIHTRSPRTCSPWQIPHDYEHPCTIRKIHLEQLSPSGRRKRLSLQAAYWSLRSGRRQQLNGPRINAKPCLHWKCYSRRWLLPSLRHL